MFTYPGSLPALLLLLNVITLRVMAIRREEQVNEELLTDMHAEVQHAGAAAALTSCDDSSLLTLEVYIFIIQSTSCSRKEQ